MPQSIIIGTRGSDLARWQANHVAGLLRQQHPSATVELAIISTKGDRILDKSLPSIGGKGLFTEELERALLDHDITCAVHSLKDLPTDYPPGLTVGAIPERAPAGDVLVSKDNLTLDDLPQGAKVGTSSVRRAAQLRAYRPDLHIIDIRGNVPTRIDKALDPASDYDAIVLAHAGVERLGLMAHVAQHLPDDIMLNAPGQGAIGIQCRDDADSLAILRPLIHRKTTLAVSAERAFLNTLEGGCSVPVAAYGSLDDNLLTLHGRVSRIDGSEQIILTEQIRLSGDDDLTDDIASAHKLGRQLARQALDRGADAILDEVRG